MLGCALPCSCEDLVQAVMGAVKFMGAEFPSWSEDTVLLSSSLTSGSFRLSARPTPMMPDGKGCDTDVMFLPGHSQSFISAL